MNLPVVTGGVLALSVLAAAGVGQHWQYTALSSHLAERDLARSLPAQQQLEAYRGESLHIRAASLSEDQAFVAYVAQALESANLPGLQGDVSSVADLLAERGRPLNFDVSAVLGNDGEVLASSGPLLARGARPTIEPLLDRADSQDAPALSVLLLGNQAVLVSLNSMQRGGSFDGYLLAGVIIGSAVLDSLAASSGSPVGLFHLAAVDRIDPLQASAGLAARLPNYATGLRGSALAGASWAEGLTEPVRTTVRVDGRDEPVQLASLFGVPQFVLVYQARSGATGVDRIVSLPWAIFGLAAALLIGAAVLWLQLRLLGPLRELGAHMETAAKGDFHRRYPVRGGALAQRLGNAFNQLLQRARQ
jgi:HAMP domain-containing protein